MVVSVEIGHVTGEQDFFPKSPTFLFVIYTEYEEYLDDILYTGSHTQAAEFVRVAIFDHIVVLHQCFKLN